MILDAEINQILMHFLEFSDSQDAFARKNQSFDLSVDHQKFESVGRDKNSKIPRL